MTSLSKPQSTPPTTIDYDQLVADYEKDLIDKLRGFGPMAEYLESWVPDEDPLKSLCNMVEAAASCGQDAISVFVGGETARRVDRAALLAAAREMGEGRIEPRGKGFVFEVTQIADDKQETGVRSNATPSRQHEAAPRRQVREENTKSRLSAQAPQSHIAASGQQGMHSIGPCYRQAVQDRQSRIIRETALAEEQGTCRIEAYADGATFILLIDRQTHIIHKAAHGGATSSVARALLDGLCELVEGLPIQEASDHGVIRLEAALFDPLARPPVPGVVTPESADPAFHLPLALIRGALRDYREVTRYQNLENEFDAGPSRAWLSLSEAEQRALLTQAFKLICQENGYSPGDILTVAIEHQVRVVVDLQGKLALGDKQQYMMKLEAGLQAKVDSRLELFLEELTDENKLRRLGQEE